MTRYWVIAPFESKNSEMFDRVWQFDLTNNVISIGWSQLGDVSNVSRETLIDVVASTFPDRPNATKSLFVNMLWSFYHEIDPNDVVIARKGRKILAAVGKVTKQGYYAPGRNPYLASPGNSHPNFLEVEWLDQPRNKIFANIVFPMHSVYEITENQYLSLVEGPITDLATSSNEAVESQNEFVLEKYLEEFIVSNFNTIFKGDLKIYEDVEGLDGQQYSTGIGPIDILAVELKSNSFVVIELKKGRPSDQVVGQILRYMGWVKENLCQGDQTVKGIVICRDPDPKLSYALKMVNNVDIRYYSVSFTLRRTP
ncbi:MAG: endonuclease NucS [Caldilineaceae bacterium]